MGAGAGQHGSVCSFSAVFRWLLRTTLPRLARRAKCVYPSWQPPLHRSCGEPACSRQQRLQLWVAGCCTSPCLPCLALGLPSSAGRASELPGGLRPGALPHERLLRLHKPASPLQLAISAGCCTAGEECGEELAAARCIWRCPGTAAVLIAYSACFTRHPHWGLRAAPRVCPGGKAPGGSADGGMRRRCRWSRTNLIPL